MNPDNIYTPNQRMLILQALYKDADYRLNTEMLQRLLRTFGHSCGIVEVNALVGYLERRGYLSCERLENGMVIAKLTRAGQDVAEGNVIAEGIDRPPVEE
jgi:hypothetical protein